MAPLHGQAMALLRSQLDKGYSLCDVVSFMLMRHFSGRVARVLMAGALGVALTAPRAAAETKVLLGTGDYGTGQ